MGVADLLAAGAAAAAVSTPPAADERAGEHAGERAPGPAAADRVRAAGDQAPAPEQHAA